MKNPNAIRKSPGDRAVLAVNYVLLALLFLIVVYPVYFVLIASVTDGKFAGSGSILLWPKGFHLNGYKYVLRDERIWTGYKNTLIYTAGGTLLGLFCSLPAGFALSKHDLPGRKLITGLFVFTMYFSGGLIPTYLVVQRLRLLNTRAVMILLGAVSVYNIILIRTFFINTIPKDLEEAAQLDGCGYVRFFAAIALPLSKAIIAVIALYLAVGYWNGYFNALIYIHDPAKKPLQVYLREILLTSTETMQQDTADKESLNEFLKLVDVIKYAVIVVSVLPVMCIYPFLQKYFVQGVMIGSLKG